MFKNASYHKLLDVATSKITQMLEMCMQEKESLNAKEIWIIKTRKQTSHNEYLFEHSFKIVVLCLDTYIDVVETVVEQMGLFLETTITEENDYVVIEYECSTVCYSDFLWDRFLKKLYENLSSVIPGCKIKKRGDIGVISF